MFLCFLPLRCDGLSDHNATVDDTVGMSLLADCLQLVTNLWQLLFLFCFSFLVWVEAGCRLLPALPLYLTAQAVLAGCGLAVTALLVLTGDHTDWGSRHQGYILLEKHCY